MFPNARTAHLAQLLVFLVFFPAFAAGEEVSETPEILGGGVGYANGTLGEACFSEPQGMIFVSSGELWVADTFNHCLRRIDFDTGSVSTLAGRCEEAGNDDERLYFPADLAICPDGRLVIADLGNGRVVTWNPDQPQDGFTDFHVTDEALGGEIALKKPIAVDCALENDRTVVFIADAEAHRIFQADGETGIWMRQANRSGESGYNPFQTEAETARQDTPADLLALFSGNQKTVFFTDSRNELLRTLRVGETSAWIIGHYIGNEDFSASLENLPDPLTTLKRPYRLAYSERDAFLVVGLPLDNRVAVVGLDRSVRLVHVERCGGGESSASRRAGGGRGRKLVRF